MYNFHFTLKTLNNDIQMDQDRTDPWFEDFLADRVDGSYNDIYFSDGIASIERRDTKGASRPVQTHDRRARVSQEGA